MLSYVIKNFDVSKVDRGNSGHWAPLAPTTRSCMLKLGTYRLLFFINSCSRFRKAKLLLRWQEEAGSTLTLAKSWLAHFIRVYLCGVSQGQELKTQVQLQLGLNWKITFVCMCCFHVISTVRSCPTTDFENLFTEQKLGWFELQYLEYW